MQLAHLTPGPSASRSANLAAEAGTKSWPAMSAACIRDILMQSAARPQYGVSIALAGVLAASWAKRGWRQSPIFGLDGGALHRLLGEHFPGVTQFLPGIGGELEVPEAFEEALELADLVAMLVENRTENDEDGVMLARAIATACLGCDHLWQDMLLPSRGVLSDLFVSFFHDLALRNRFDMKWKKFLYKQLCERAEIRLCKAPSCGVCSDYKLCFGAE